MAFDLTLAAIIAGFIIDLIVGDPYFIYHPVRIIGSLVEILEKAMRKIFPETKKGQRAGGALLAVIVFLVSAAVPFGLLCLCRKISLWLWFIMEIIMCWQLTAVKSMRTESMKVYRALKGRAEERLHGFKVGKSCGNFAASGDAADLPDSGQRLEEARKAVSMIVGRDTENLSEEGVIKAAVETIAEGCVDGIISPIFYMAIGGPAAGFAYKSVNTMDSMIGYKNDKYMYFGTCAARMDDVLNFIPARLGGCIMSLAAFLCGLNGRGAWRIFKRDRKKHKSPNSAHTESAMAGALGIQLAGDAYYFGKLCEKPVIGDALRPVRAEDIKLANRLMYTTSVLALLIFSAARFAVTVIFF